ncbi:imidazoleglycerol-phosphate dehydratase [Desulfohalotomaculum tongense]|uniref:imidazoleglycerol-phosphate dehydratase HisB n=1 Tax=Desulforadius tongensis TaxID=1216062 RepID=UPI00195E7B4B|nr:imidazoleglycerol-phosphate dehydratase HisB [Desulforadius tongensis]MBM7854265.1 imidazoleglycerol-phosphate dehydratase [Desulforadius tongensis]
MVRESEVKRQTAETNISVYLNIDGTGKGKVSTEIGFFDHMLNLWCKHGGFDLELYAQGDLCVDCHHTVEDVGICLGKAVKQALGDKAGITRYGQAFVPMDEALALAVVDFSGRGFLEMDAHFPSKQVGEFDTELVEEFLRALAVNGEFTLHVRLLSGKNTHHIIEAIFKALGRAMRQAAEQDPKITGIPSTKGVL